MEERISRIARAGLLLAGALAGAWISWLLGSIEADTLTSALARWAAPALAAVAAAGCLARAAAIRAERPAWLLFGLAALLWGVGGAVTASAGAGPVVDALRIAFHPLAAAGLVALLWWRADDLSPPVLLDAAAAALAAAALAAAVPVEATFGRGATELAHALGDLTVLALLAGGAALAGFRRDQALGWVAAGLVLVALVDAVALGRAVEHVRLADAGTALALLMLAWAAWRPGAGEAGVVAGRAGSPAVHRAAPIARLPTPAEGSPAPPGGLRDSWRELLVPAVFGPVALAVIVHERLATTNGLAIVLATGALVAVLARAALVREPDAAPSGRRRRSPAGAPAGVVGRLDLLAEIDSRLRSCTPERPLLVAFFELDDFHHYTDLFGEAAGDALLARVGHGLATVVGERGSAQRSGPAEFCLIAEPGTEGPGRTVSRAAAVLFERGRGFALGCSHGAVLLPAEARDGREALQRAAERMRIQRDERRASGVDRAGDALAEALEEHDPERREQRREIAQLADDTARKLRMPDEEIAQIRVAAGLHDVGKIAIPGTILDKVGPLDEAEWRFVQRHTTIGERLVAAAPDLAEAAAIVRGVHERWDGSGYPDGLAGQRTPLGSRIVAVCGAYDAMTTNRPYRRALTVPAALAELRRCAGLQFDPDVVEAFCLALLDHPVERP